MTTYTSTLRRLFTVSLLCAFLLPACAQTLARPGWEGSGINTDAWWKYPVIYEVNPANFDTTNGSGLHGVAQHLDYIQSLGVDALLLTHIPLDSGQPPTIAPAYGTLDDLDDLIHEASRRNVRVLLDLNPDVRAATLANEARFWLNRGIAGFHVVGTTPEAHAQASALRKIASTYLGQRILIGDVDPTLSTSPQQRTYKAPDPQAPQLLLDASLGTVTPLTPPPIRATTESTENIQLVGHSIALFASDGPSFPRSITRYGDGQHNREIAKVLATVLFTTRAQALLYYGQELGVPAAPADTAPSAPVITWEAPPPPPKNQPAPPPPPYDPNAAPNAALEEADPSSLLNWYRKLIDFHHSNATINSGEYMTINRDDQNVLITIRKPKVVSPTNPVLVILCNLSGQPQHLSLKTDITKLHLRGSFLRTVIRSDNGMGTMHLESMTLAPYASYIGELRF